MLYRMEVPPLVPRISDRCSLRGAAHEKHRPPVHRASTEGPREEHSADDCSLGPTLGARAMVDG